MFRFDNLLLLSNLESIRIDTEGRHIIGIHKNYNVYATIKFVHDDRDLTRETSTSHF